MQLSDVFYETVKTLNGKRQVRRLKTSFILTCGVLFIPLGIFLLYQEKGFGFFLIVPVAPCFLIYPAVRLLFFGGKDSVAGVVTTVVIEEVTKAKIKDSFKKRRRKKRKW